ncbi:MAG: thioredoxin [Acidobacteriota bacterium]
MSQIVTCPSCGAKNRLAVGGAGVPQCGKCHDRLPWIVDAGDADFATAIDAPTAVLVDLWAPWCGPCRAVAPVLEELARDYAGKLKIVKVNVDHNPQIAASHRAQSIPMLVIYRSGKIVDTVIGAQPRPAIEARLRAHL